ncbi:MAG TPA: CocE/NonD family hydrolase [Thermoanaerobaculia bacterium]|nr:CocE/NonD family hydrolase [Thermoanaerobaculia bacterium]
MTERARVACATWSLVVLGAVASGASTATRSTVGADPAVATVLTLPDGRATHAAVLVPVAGPSDADMSLGSLGIHREAAEILARHGIATLRLASRGVDGSGGDWLASSFADRRRDLLAAVAALRADPRLAGARLGMVGTSEGAALAVAAAEEAGAHFVVALSLPMTDGIGGLRWQRDRAVESAPVSEAEKQAFVAASERLLSAVLEKDEAAVRVVLDGPMGAMLLPPYAMVPTEAEARLRFALSPWYRSQLELDVSAAAAALRMPTLAVYGGRDRVVDADGSAARLRAIPTAGSLFTVRVEPDRGHLLLREGDGPAAIDGVLWEAIAEWILERPTRRDADGG